jgi:hypothetical protein
VTPGYINILLHASCISNKTLESCNIWVNYRVPSFCATDAPGHNADKLATNNQRAARITLASECTATRHTSTDHVLSDSFVNGINTIAFCTRCDVQVDCLEYPNGPVTMNEFSPATDYSKGTSSRFWRSKRNWLNSWPVFEWSRYLKWSIEIIEVFYWKDGCLPRMICAIINHCMICIQPPTVCVLQSYDTINCTYG